MNQTQFQNEEAVAAANERFYRALEANDLDAMSDVWLHAEWVKCVHPGWDLLIGWEAVRASWAGIFAGGSRMRVSATEVEIKLEGNFAVVSCYENLAVFLDRTSAPVSARTTATNLFQRVGDDWKLIHHHASSVSDAPQVADEDQSFDE